jgi:hypothetical protein
LQSGSFRRRCRVLRALSAEPLKRCALLGKAALLRCKPRLGIARAMEY